MRLPLLLFLPWGNFIVCAMLVLAVAPAMAAQPIANEVTFEGAGQVKLSGTLLLPHAAAASEPAAARFPAALLIQGSGPTDRDGSQPPALKIDLLKQLAEHLAAHGVATLRFDKRGQYRSGAAPKDQAALVEFVAWDNYVDDVVAAMRALQQQPQIDPARVALVGHSEGGLLVMHACKRVQEKAGEPAAVVLLSTPGRPIDVVLRDQLERILTAQGATPDQKKFFLDKNDAIASAIRQTGVVPTDVPPGLQALYPAYLGKFWQGQLKSAPADLATALEPPVLIIQGDRDQQEAPGDAAALAEAINRGRKGKTPAELVVIRGASHNLKAAKEETDPGIKGPVVPEALKAISDWMISAPRR